MLHTKIIYTDKMICNDNLAGIPLLILANKQDIPDCMGVREVKPIFNQNAHLIGRRDFMVMPISALTGYLLIVLISTFLNTYSWHIIFDCLSFPNNRLTFFFLILDIPL